MSLTYIWCREIISGSFGFSGSGGSSRFIMVNMMVLMVDHRWRRCRWRRSVNLFLIKYIVSNFLHDKSNTHLSSAHRTSSLPVEPGSNAFFTKYMFTMQHCGILQAIVTNRADPAACLQVVCTWIHTVLLKVD